MRKLSRHTIYLSIFFLLEFLLIVTYLHKKPVPGLIVWVFIMFLSVRIMKRDKLGYLVLWLIASIPVSYLEITCEIGTHIFKWFNLCIVLLTIYLLKCARWKIKLANEWLTVIIVMLIFQLIRNLFLFEDFVGSPLIELIQEWIIVIPVCLFYSHIKVNRNTINTALLVRQWEGYYLNMVTACAVGVLYQYFMDRQGIRLGFITAFAVRRVYDMTFTGFSVLSALLGGGMVIGMSRLLRHFRVSYLLSLILCALACAINTSRSGFLAAFVVIAILMLKQFHNGWKISVKKIMLYCIFAVVAAVSIFMLMRTRISLKGVNLLNDNGRFDLIIEFVKTILVEAKTFLFGTGMYSHISQHNMFLEFWLRNGTIAGVLFIGFILLLLFRTRKSSMNYLIWHLFLAQQFFTGFFAATFLLPVLFLLLAGNMKAPPIQRETIMIKLNERSAIDLEEKC